MARGILETIGLAGSVLLAAPAALFGAQEVLEGSLPLGVAFLSAAVLMIVIPRVVVTPGDVLGRVAERTVAWVVGTDE